MQSGSRRKFVKTGLITGGVIVAGLGWNAQKHSHRGTIRLLPVEGIAYSESFLRFMKRARFDSVRDAIASIRDRTLQVRIAHASYANDLY
jgi:hypothetical protein